MLDNVSDPKGRLGENQLQWLEADVKRQSPDAQIIVLAHRPLFELYPQWDWWTGDGAQAVNILMNHPKVTVFYGHIHQEHHFATGHIAHHAAKSLIFALPAAGSQPKRATIPWNASAPYSGRAGPSEPHPAGCDLPLTCPDSFAQRSRLEVQRAPLRGSFFCRLFIIGVTTTEHRLPG
jgi:hypothetical protein